MHRVVLTPALRWKLFFYTLFWVWQTQHACFRCSKGKGNERVRGSRCASSLLRAYMPSGRHAATAVSLPTVQMMLTGAATKLESQFRLKWNMILNLLRVEDM